MNIKTYNKSLASQSKKALNFAFAIQSDPNDQQILFANDTDSVRYKIVSRLNIVNLYFFFTDLKTVWNYCGQYFKEKYYKYARVSLKNIDNSDALQISIDNQILTAYNQNFKSQVESGILTGKKKLDPLFDFLSKKLASVKRHFFASPIEMMIDAISSKDGKKLPSLCYNVKPNGGEKVWISFEKNQFTISYGVNFDDRSEQQLCKIFFSELVDSKKHVHNPPGISINESEPSKTLMEAFPQQRSKKYRFSNGILSFTINPTIVKKPQTIATYLAGFRNYVYYHIQAQKCYLHSRVLRRIGMLNKDLNQTKIEPFAIN